MIVYLNSSSDIFYRVKSNWGIWYLEISTWPLGSKLPRCLHKWAMKCPMAFVLSFLYMLHAPKKVGNLIPLNSPPKPSYPMGDRLAQTALESLWWGSRNALETLVSLVLWGPHTRTWLLLLQWTALALACHPLISARQCPGEETEVSETLLIATLQYEEEGGIWV